METIKVVSLGPGEPELITLKGLEALKNADVILCPETITMKGRRLSRSADIMSRLGISESAIKKFTITISHERGDIVEVYAQAAKDAEDLARSGKKVALAAEGDVSLYCTVNYISENLQKAGVPVEHIPGIPAFVAAGAVGALHTVKLEERLTIIPGIVTADEIEALLSHGGAVVIMKLSQAVDEVRKCISRHPEFAYHYFENVGGERERYTKDSAEIASIDFPYFSLLIIQSGR